MMNQGARGIAALQKNTCLIGIADIACGCGAASARRILDVSSLNLAVPKGAAFFLVEGQVARGAGALSSGIHSHPERISRDCSKKSRDLIVLSMF